MDTIATPLISAVTNLHGTSADELREALLVVRAGVRNVLRAAEDASPNGRDYYPQGPDAYKKAVAGHAAVCAGLGQVANELLELAENPAGGAMHQTAAMLLSVPPSPEVFPAVHANGTSIEVLMNMSVAVFRGTQSLEDDVCTIVPNLRDYQDHASWKVARSQHADRVTLIKRVGGYFLSIATECRRQTSAARSS